MDKHVEDYLDAHGVTARTRAFLQKEKGHYIYGSFTAGSATMPALEPCTGKLLAEVPSGTREDIDAAVAAARHAFLEAAVSYSYATSGL